MVAVVWKMPLGYSLTYGSPDLANHLFGGSGGGGGDAYGGGAGGGAVELFAHGDGVLTITSGGKILANGGDTSTSIPKAVEPVPVERSASKAEAYRLPAPWKPRVATV